METKQWGYLTIEQLEEENRELRARIAELEKELRKERELNWSLMDNF